MKRAILILIAAACAANAQTTSITVMADTNRAVRTNFTIGNAQVTGLSALLDGKLATNGNAAGITNITAANITGTVALASNVSGIVAIANGGTGGANASNARVSLGLGTAATNPASAFQPASATLTNLANGDGSGLTNISGASNPTGNGGSLTNLTASNIVGSVPVVSGGTGGTNAATALAGLLPSYTANSGKVLAVATNETSVEWITAGGGGGSGTVTSVDASGGSTGLLFTGGPITTNGTLSLGGTLAVGAGGTGASDVTNARINLLPSYTNNAGKVLAINSSTNNLEWVSVPSSPVSIANGGTGATNAATALDNLAITKTSDTVALLSTNAGSKSVVIGSSASATNGNAVAIGRDAIAYSANGVAIGNSSVALSGVALGYASETTAGGSIGDYARSTDGGAVGKGTFTETGAAVGKWAFSYDGVALGNEAEATGNAAVQLGNGTNNSNNTIQFRNAGKVDTNEWARIAALSTYPTTNISVTGTNNTNTLVFSNGILVEVQ